MFPCDNVGNMMTKTCLISKKMTAAAAKAQGQPKLTFVIENMLKAFVSVPHSFRCLSASFFNKVQTIRITRTMIRDNAHDLNDTRGQSFY